MNAVSNQVYQFHNRKEQEQEGLNCKVLAGGDAGQDQLREEPVGSQLTSLPQIKEFSELASYIPKYLF